MKEYSELEKNKARELALNYAVETLTKNRNSCTISRKGYVNEVKNYILKNGSTYDIKLTTKLNEKEVKHWDDFYESIVGHKSASDLRIAYLSGPNPENDVEVLVKSGILPENIWAFESDNKTYSKAVFSALNSKFPYLKIFKGRIENYLAILPFKFDIIYLDFCSTLLSSKTISVVKEVFNHSKLVSPGILITNFGLPKNDEKNEPYRNKIDLFAANYLYPKSFTEKYKNLGGSYIDSPFTCGIDNDEFLKIVKRNSSTFYSQLITRVLYDLPSVIIPYQKLYSDQMIYNSFFKNFNRDVLNDEYNEDLDCNPNENSLVWGLSDFWINNNSLKKVLNSFKGQIALDGNVSKLMDSIELAKVFTSEGLGEEYYSDKLYKIRKAWNMSSAHIFCDVFLFHQFNDLLISQITCPYFYNVEFTKRWTYKAKETEMFLDVITYDQCRYIFDWMPTLDMFEAGVRNIDRQLSLRFAMDGIAKQRRWYNDEFFCGTAIVDQNKVGFEAQELEKRIEI